MVESRKLFTLTEARRALPLVRSIAADLQEAVNRLTRLPGGTAVLYGATQVEELPVEIRRQAADNHDQIETLRDELTEIGVELKGFQPILVDFPSRRNGEIIYLCWADGETDIGFWHDLSSGFRGRQPL